MDPTHYAFSDDSKHCDGRFNSLGLISLRKSYVKYIEDELKNIFRNSNIGSEFKWAKLRNAQYRFCAQKMIDLVFRNEQKIRVDVIIWDLKDRRHNNVAGRDDSENLVRMYYHLISTTCSKRWPITQACWEWYPDIQSSVIWKTLQDCINNKRHACVNDLFGTNPDFEKVNLIVIKPTASHKHPIIQLADLFAGIGSYSWGHFERFIIWEKYRGQQSTLFPDMNKVSFSPGECEKFETIVKLNEKCKQSKLKIAFKSTRGFKSNDICKFINFWLYQPQHILDKAPSKISTKIF